MTDLRNEHEVDKYVDEVSKILRSDLKGRLFGTVTKKDRAAGKTIDGAAKSPSAEHLAKYRGLRDRADTTYSLGSADAIPTLRLSVPSPADVLDFGLKAAPVIASSPLADLIGPVYDRASVCDLLDISRQQVHDRGLRGTILALRTADEVWAYPAFQFKDGQISPGVRKLLRLFRPSVLQDPWTVAAWFTAPKLDLGGSSPIDLLREGGVPNEVRELAEATASRWAA